MNTLLALYNGIFGRLERQEWLLPTLARFVFAATLVGYFWKSGLTKLGDGIFGIFSPSTGAYAQIFPKAIEAVGYDASQLSFFHWLVVFGGTVAEFILPLLIIIGLLSRLSAIGMIGFVIVQTLTDLYGHHLIDDPKSVGAWFDRFPDSILMDQRTFWIFVLLVIVVKGGGPLSVDHILKKRFQE
ncbi:DoxX family membrane protein [Shimia abyssi]|uniref:Putative oxidoreductase n=1 Tax=Shimia abyssi TaxID=1662395 RepID=A0A2P8FJ91_9RHOB|nr:DoxX family membrane protein [Shimia abyssi]PSL21791.1 putative oxidoreductase [Shimia abyssi]